ncbi:hypothetical protein GCK32_015532 [Trichostrongylus colubriformis]|uniref:Uncharacterized protein n=1 Tax=Trichostrongylus colubriformis TaxID=6319 RepID=A0AAN8FE57_TRICO
MILCFEKVYLCSWLLYVEQSLFRARSEYSIEDVSPTSPSHVSLTSLTNVTYVDISSRAEDIQAGLIDTFLNLEKIDKNLFLARHLLKGRNSLPVVYGGQVIGQALSAATATVGSGFLPNSLHSYFVQSGMKRQHADSVHG